VTEIKIAFLIIGFDNYSPGRPPKHNGFSFVMIYCVTGLSDLLEQYLWQHKIPMMYDNHLLALCGQVFFEPKATEKKT